LSGRRSHVRFEVLQSPEGVLRVMRDVLVQSVGRHEVVAISREPGVLGEIVAFEVSVSAQEPGSGMAVRVVESHPVVENGTVRHRLRLETVGAARD